MAESNMRERQWDRFTFEVLRGLKNAKTKMLMSGGNYNFASFR